MTSRSSRYSPRTEPYQRGSSNDDLGTDPAKGPDLETDQTAAYSRDKVKNLRAFFTRPSGTPPTLDAKGVRSPRSERSDGSLSSAAKRLLERDLAKAISAKLRSKAEAKEALLQKSEAEEALADAEAREIQAELRAHGSNSSVRSVRSVISRARTEPLLPTAETEAGEEYHDATHPTPPTTPRRRTKGRSVCGGEGDSYIHDATAKIKKTDDPNKRRAKSPRTENPVVTGNGLSPGRTRSSVLGDQSDLLRVSTDTDKTVETSHTFSPPRASSQTPPKASTAMPTIASHDRHHH